MQLQSIILALAVAFAATATPSQAEEMTYVDPAQVASIVKTGVDVAVIVRLDPEPTLLWVASMSLASNHTTNNHAEYNGLCQGLTAAERHSWTPLEVIGDSKMIIKQMQLRRRPTAANLQPMYERARSTADAINVRHWHHHYRTYNKMADKAANQAMDSCSSYQSEACHGRRELQEIRQWLVNDYYHWAEATAARSQIESRRLQQRPAEGGTGRLRPEPPEHRPTEM